MEERPSQTSQEREDDESHRNPGETGLEAGNSTFDTSGGSVIIGNITVPEGDFVGRDKIIFTEETAYNVQGLPNPYLGLRAFDYLDQDKYAGRSDSIHQAMEKLTRQRARQVLLFITGASGCGKSSFAQAGMLPALESFYRKRKKQVLSSVFRPASDPIAALADALVVLGLPGITPDELENLSPEQLAQFLEANRTDSLVRLLLIDQFEEFFTQSSHDHRKRVFGFLTRLPAFEAGQLHVLATLRSDFLDELFNDKHLWDVAIKGGVELRAMSAKELKEAIRQPMEAVCTGLAPKHAPDERYCRKQFEPSLLDRLAVDASQDAAYLPLLQVTVYELWNQGSLKLEKYTDLTDAIRHRAETVYGYIDFNESQPLKERPKKDRDEIVEIFLDLLNVSLDDDRRRDVRRRRLKAELTGDSLERQRLVAELINARLLSTATIPTGEAHAETIDIIHESLIENWDRLWLVIDERREQLRRRARFEQQLAEWLRNHRSKEDLLYGKRLQEAREMIARDDIALRSADARELYRLSATAAARTRLTALARLVAAIAAIAIVSTLALTGLLPRWLFQPLPIEWVPIPAGEFRMGSTEDEINFAHNLPVDQRGTGGMYVLDNERTEHGMEHLVYIDEYQISRYETTNKQYSQCVRAQVCAPPDNTKYLDPQLQNYPLTDVDWENARKFCEWSGSRLPTEAQWEKAARAQPGQDSKIFPWGNYLPDPNNPLANVNSGLAMPVGSFSPDGDSSYGVADMAGNAWEWVWDWYADYYYYDPASRLPNPQGPASGYTHTIKGGSFVNDWVQARSSYRSNSVLSGASSEDVGFRCAR